MAAKKKAVVKKAAESPDYGYCVVAKDPKGLLNLCQISKHFTEIESVESFVTAGKNVYLALKKTGTAIAGVELATNTEILLMVQAEVRSFGDCYLWMSLNNGITAYDGRDDTYYDDERQAIEHIIELGYSVVYTDIRQAIVSHLANLGISFKPL